MRPVQLYFCEEQPTRVSEEQLAARARAAAEHWRAVASGLCACRGVKVPLMQVRLVADGPPLGLRVPRDLSRAELFIRRDYLLRYPRQMIGQLLPYHVAHLTAGILYGAGSRQASAMLDAVLMQMGKADLPLLRPPGATDSASAADTSKDYSWLTRQ